MTPYPEDSYAHSGWRAPGLSGPVALTLSCSMCCHLASSMGASLLPDAILRAGETFDISFLSALAPNSLQVFEKIFTEWKTWTNFPLLQTCSKKLPPRRLDLEFADLMFKTNWCLCVCVLLFQLNVLHQRLLFVRRRTRYILLGKIV